MSWKWPIGTSGTTGTIGPQPLTADRRRFALGHDRHLAVEDEGDVRQAPEPETA